MNDIKFDTIIIIFISEKNIYYNFVGAPGGNSLYCQRGVCTKDTDYKSEKIPYEWGISSNGRAPA